MTLQKKCIFSVLLVFVLSTLPVFGSGKSDDSSSSTPTTTTPTTTTTSEPTPIISGGTIVGQTTTTTTTTGTTTTTTTTTATITGTTTTTTTTTTPGNTTPDNTTPDNTTPGNTTPGNTTPGNTTSSPPPGPTIEELRADATKNAVKHEGLALTAKTDTITASGEVVKAKSTIDDKNNEITILKVDNPSNTASKKATEATDAAAGVKSSAIASQAVCTDNYSVFEKYTRITTTASTLTNTDESKKQKSPQTGDPVLITSGKYVLNETDLSLNLFDFKRNYISDSVTGGSLGTGWSASIDTRIIRGISPVDTGSYTIVQAKVKAIYDAWFELDKQAREYSVLATTDIQRDAIANQEKAAAIKTSAQASYEEINAQITLTETPYATVISKEAEVRAERTLTDDAANSIPPPSAAAIKSAENAATYADEAKTAKEAADAAILSMNDTAGLAKIEVDTVSNQAIQSVNDFEGSQKKICDVAQAIIVQDAADVYELYDGAQKLLNQIKTESERAALLHALNRFTLFTGSPSNYEETGNETITIIDETGAPVNYAYEGNGVWTPRDPVLSKTDRIESIDGTGADTKAGFRLFTKNGIVNTFDANGLLVAITDRNGNASIFTRNSGSGKLETAQEGNKKYAFVYTGRLLSKITAPENQTVNYHYSDSNLSGVTDVDGDTVNYQYEDGRLSKIVKPDESFISLSYGYTTSGNTKLVSMTTNEEGFSEHFDYDISGKLTVYANHSGVITSSWYDADHRLVREKHSDGTSHTYTYNSANGLLDSESINGDKIDYTYDTRGNKNNARYSDGSNESWEWNAFDEMTKYIDRDGITTSWTYNVHGNCSNIYRDGIQIFAGTYDGTGLLLTGVTGNRATETYTYDGYGYLSSRIINLESGPITEKWVHDAVGRITSYTDGANQKWTYQYEGKTITEILPSGLERKSTSNSRKDITNVTERDTSTGETRVTTIVYDKRHLPLRITDPTKNITIYAYREDGNLLSIVQGKWKTEYRYDSTGRACETVRTMEGNADSWTEKYQYEITATGEKSTVVQPLGVWTAYQKDQWGNVASVTDSTNTTSGRTVSADGRIKREQSATGGWYGFAYDGAGRLIEAGKEGDKAVSVMYNADGTLATKTDREGNVTSYAYDGRGLPKTETTEGGTIRYAYDGAGRVTGMENITRHSSGNDAGISSTTWDYSAGERTVTVTAGSLYPTIYTMNAWGEIVSRKDGEGIVCRWTYDGNGKLKTAQDAYENMTSYSWNAIGKIDTIAYPDKTVESREYNHLGFIVKVTDALGTVWEGKFDDAGRLANEKGRPGIDKSYTYDSLGRILSVKTGDEIAEQYRYTDRGRTIVSTDGKGKDYTYQKDEFGVLTGEKNRTGFNQYYAFDEEGNLSTSISFSGKNTHIETDAATGTTTTAYSDGTKTVIVKNHAGLITQATGTTGTINYEYDAGGKLIRQFDERSGEETFYRYDKAGRRTRMTSGNRTVFYAYGNNGELLSVEDSSTQLSVHFAYDIMGRETTRSYGNGVVQETAYDKIGRKIAIREISSSRSLIRGEGYVYDDEGRRSYTVDEAGKVTSYEYDGQSRLAAVNYPSTDARLAVEKEETEQAGLIFTANKGQLSSIPSDAQKALRAVLDLMSPSRSSVLPPSQLVWRETYTYDGNGNRATKTTLSGTVTYAYDDENRLVSMGKIQYTYDRDGNLLSEKGLIKSKTYEYTDTNRMKSSIVSDTNARTSSSTEYAYDAFGRRTLAQDTGSEAMRTLYDGLSFDVIRNSVTFNDGSFTSNYSHGTVSQADTSGNGNRYRYISDGSTQDKTRSLGTGEYAVNLTRYTGLQTPLFANGESVAMSRSPSNSSSQGGSSTRGGSSYFGSDLIGSTRSSTDAYGSLEDRYEYDAFGKPYAGDFTTGLDVGYTGKPYDPMTGLYNYGYRDYAPEEVRFTTVDPIRDGNNWFAYVNNDPVNFLDEFGLADKDAYDKMHPTEISNQKNTLTSLIPTTSLTNNSPSISRNRNGEEEESKKYGVNPDWGTLDSINMASAGALINGLVGKGIVGAVLSLGNYGNAEMIGTATKKLLVDNDPVGAAETLGFGIGSTLFGNFLTSNQGMLKMKNDAINSSLNFGITNSTNNILTNIFDSYKAKKCGGN